MPDSTDSLPSAADVALHKKRLKWGLLLMAGLIYPGSHIALIAYVNFGGWDIKDFCRQELVGQPPTLAKELAIRSGFAVIEREGLLRVTTDPGKSRHSCDLKVEAGKVTLAKAFFRF